MSIDLKLPILLKQTAIRANALLIIKVIGLFGRVALSRMIGTEGVGLFQLVYAYYGFMLTLITGGLPTTVALETASNHEQGWLLFKKVSLVLISTSAILSLTTYTYSKEISRLMGNEQLDFAIRCLAPALFTVPLLLLLKGFMQGLERYGAIAKVEVIEQMMRVGSMLLLVFLWLPAGHSFAVGGGILGTTISAIIAFLILTLIHRKPEQAPGSLTIQPLLTAALQASMAIALTKIIIPASDFIDAILIQQRLQAAGFTPNSATEIYGIVAGMAVILVYMPTLVSSALSHTLTMKLVSDWQEKRKTQFYRRVIQALELNWTWGWFSAVFLFGFSNELCWLFFGTTEPSLSVKYLAVVPLLVGSRELTTSVLWAQNRRSVPFWGLFCGISVGMVIIYFFIAVPGIEIAAITISIVAMELIASIWNLSALMAGRDRRQRIRIFHRSADILIAICLCVLANQVSAVMNLSAPINIISKITFYGSFAGIYFIMRFRSNLQHK